MQSVNNYVIFEGQQYSFTGRADDPISVFHHNQHKFYELQTLTYLKNLLSKLDLDQSVIVDAGANIGNHSVFFANQFPANSVIAFEMNKETFGYLEKNIENNSLTNVQAVNKGLSNASGCCGVRIVKDNPLGGAQLDFESSDKSVELTTLDDYARKMNKSSRIALIKIDVEGHEYECIEGCRKIIEKDRPMLFLECKEVDEFVKITDYLEQYGYQVINAAAGSLPNFLYVHSSSLSKLFSEEEMYQMRKELCLRHVKAWQLHREINKLKKAKKNKQKN